MSDMHSERLTIRISRELRRKIEAAARERRKGPSQVVRETLENHLSSSETAHAAFTKAGLIGIVKKGPRDLSTNKRHMSGFGRKK
jgi:predicted DNA-binding protein